MPLGRDSLVAAATFVNEPSNMSFKRGTTLETTSAAYTIQEQISLRGTATVYRATDSGGNVQAIKVLHRERTTTAGFKRFHDEILFCSSIAHRNVIRVKDRGLTEAAEPFYVMQHYSGTLRQLIRHGVEPTSVLRLFGQMLDGVEAAHLKRVWHGDLKPENVLYDNATEILVIADFGIARCEDGNLRSGVGANSGEQRANLPCAAPEHRIRGPEVSAAADVCALGLILNEMFTGRVPLGSGYRRIAAVAPEFAHLDGIVDRMIQPAGATHLDSVTSVKEQIFLS